MIYNLFFQKYWMSVNVYCISSFGCEKRRDLWQNGYTLRVDSVVRVSGQSSNHTIGLIKLKREVVSECTVPFFTTVHTTKNRRVNGYMYNNSVFKIECFAPFQTVAIWKDNICLISLVFLTLNCIHYKCKLF